MTGIRYGATDAGVTAALVALGATPGEVADTLLAAGHLGDQSSCRTCPVAVYLTEVTAREAEVDGRHAAILVGRNAANELDWLVVDLPAPVADFVRDFDRADTPHRKLVRS